MNASASAAWSARLALAGLGAWGLIHIAGGVSLLAADTTEALDTLAPNATTAAPDSLGDATTAVVRFHALNIALGGVAVLLLAVLWYRHRRRWMRDAALGIAVTLDVGLVVFLVGPGLLPVSQGFIGPALVVFVVATIIIEHRRPAV